jgi:hypothetical protein
MKRKKSVAVIAEGSFLAKITCHQGPVFTRDARHHFHQGNDASGNIDSVPKRDGFSPA